MRICSRALRIAVHRLGDSPLPADDKLDLEREIVRLRVAAERLEALDRAIVALATAPWRNRDTQSI
jgi:hypothetical protein